LIKTISPRMLPAMADNKLYLDYISGSPKVSQFYPYGPLDFLAALRSRSKYSYPREEASRALAEYNASLGAGPTAMRNIAALREGSTFCVISGHQAGFLGGPAFTTYKIATTIRLAHALQDSLGVRVVPLFWMASEDHDFSEISRAYILKEDGEVGSVRFGWAEAGRPVSDLPVDENVLHAYRQYFDSFARRASSAQLRDIFAPRSGENYCQWHARVWSDLFSDHGLVIVEPHVIRPLGGSFFQYALEHTDTIVQYLRDVSHRLEDAGYQPALTSEQAGYLYTFDSAGRRVRVEDPKAHAQVAHAHPERYSTDAALRPLFADSILPVIADILGPGEVAYHASLKPLYDLWALPQPVLFPRKSYTVAGQREIETLMRYGTSVEEIIAGRLDLDSTLRKVIPSSDFEMFSSARCHVDSAYVGLRAYLEQLDPSLAQTWARSRTGSLHYLDKLEQRALRARLSQLGLSKKQLHTLRNTLLPRGRLQERVFPLPHYLARYGLRFTQQLLDSGELTDFSHHVLVLEDQSG